MVKGAPMIAAPTEPMPTSMNTVRWSTSEGSARSMACTKVAPSSAPRNSEEENRPPR